MLEHLRIIELGQVIAGTFGGMILSDLGADVIKVEPPNGDAGRRSAIYGIGDESAIHLTHNRNKRSVVLDLKTEGGREVLFDLIRIGRRRRRELPAGRDRSARRRSSIACARSIPPWCWCRSRGSAGRAVRATCPPTT